MLPWYPLISLITVNTTVLNNFSLNLLKANAPTCCHHITALNFQISHFGKPDAEIDTVYFRFEFGTYKHFLVVILTSSSSVQNSSFIFSKFGHILNQQGDTHINIRIRYQIKTRTYQLSIPLIFHKKEQIHMLHKFYPPFGTHFGHICMFTEGILPRQHKHGMWLVTLEPLISHTHRTRKQNTSAPVHQCTRAPVHPRVHAHVGAPSWVLMKFWAYLRTRNVRFNHCDCIACTNVAVESLTKSTPTKWTPK